MMVIQDIAKISDDLKFKVAAMPIYGKNHSDDFFLQNHWADLSDISHEASGALHYIK